MSYNVRRDSLQYEELRAGGWRVIVVWECEIKELQVLSNRLLQDLGPSGSDCIQ